MESDVKTELEEIVDEKTEIVDEGASTEESQEETLEITTDEETSEDVSTKEEVDEEKPLEEEAEKETSQDMSEDTGNELADILYIKDIPDQAQTLTGEKDRINIFIIDGLSTDYKLDLTNMEKGVTVANAEFSDLLTGFQGIIFNDVMLDLETGKTISTEEDPSEILIKTSDDKPEESSKDTSDDILEKTLADEAAETITDATSNQAVTTSTEYDTTDDTTNDTSVPADPYINKVADKPDTTQYLTGEAGKKNIFVVDGLYNDYAYGPSEDGHGIVLWNDTGFDVLFGYDGIEFKDIYLDVNTGQQYLMDAEYYYNVIEDDAMETQHLLGSHARVDIFKIDGKMTDYHVGTAEDGIGTVIWNDHSFDVIHNFDIIEFSDYSVNVKTGAIEPIFTIQPVDDMPVDHTEDDTSTDTDTPDSEETTSPLLVQNEDGVQIIQGTDADEAFVINDVSANYGIAAIEDNGVIVYSAEEFDLLYDIEEIQFTDDTISLDEFTA